MWYKGSKLCPHVVFNLTWSEPPMKWARQACGWESCCESEREREAEMERGGDREDFEDKKNEAAELAC